MSNEPRISSQPPERNQPEPSPTNRAAVGDGERGDGRGGGGGGGEPVVPEDRSMILWVLLGGLIGALTAKLAGADLFGRDATLPWMGCLFVGPVAAGVGVYLLAGTDTRNFGRTVFFAAACGLAGPSILIKGVETTKGLVGIKADKQSEKADATGQELKSASEDGTPSQVATLSLDAGAQSVQLIATAKQARDVGQDAAADKAEAAVVSLVKTLKAAAPTQSESTLRAIEMIGKEAKKQSISTVTEAVEGAVKQLATNAAAPAASKAVEVAENLKIVIPNPTAKALGRVYLQLPPNSPGTSAMTQGRFAVAGFDVRGTATGTDLDAKELRVNYYRAEDKDEAEKLLKAVKALLPEDKRPPNAEVQDKSKVANPRPRNYDLRIGPETLTLLQEALKKAGDRSEQTNPQL